MSAAASGHVDAVQYAFDLGADVKAVSATKQTAVSAAVAASLQTTTADEIVKVVEFLKSKGAEVDSAVAERLARLKR